MLTIKQMSDKTGLSAHTLRFYDKEGLFPFVTRDKNNVRLFSLENLEWINLICCLRETGMSLEEIKHYIELSNQGNTTAQERYRIILKQKETAEFEVMKMQERVALLQKKLDYYDALMSKDGDFWNTTNCKII